MENSGEDFTYANYRIMIERKIRKLDSRNIDLARKLKGLNSEFYGYERKASMKFLPVANKFIHAEPVHLSHIEEVEYQENYKILSSALDRLLASQSQLHGERNKPEMSTPHKSENWSSFKIAACVIFILALLAESMRNLNQQTRHVADPPLQGVNALNSNTPSGNNSESDPNISHRNEYQHLEQELSKKPNTRIIEEWVDGPESLREKNIPSENKINGYSEQKDTKQEKVIEEWVDGPESLREKTIPSENKINGYGEKKDTKQEKVIEEWVDGPEMQESNGRNQQVNPNSNYNHRWNNQYPRRGATLIMSNSQNGQPSMNMEAPK